MFADAAIKAAGDLLALAASPVSNYDANFVLHGQNRSC